MSMSYKDNCRDAIEYLYKKMRKLEKKKSWNEKDSEEYENIEAYCSAIHGALEVIAYYEEREAILIDRFGKEAIEDAGKAWLNLKMAQCNEMFGFTSEDFKKWEEGHEQKP